MSRRPRDRQPDKPALDGKRISEGRVGCASSAADATQGPPLTLIRPIPCALDVLESGLGSYNRCGVVALTTTLRPSPTSLPPGELAGAVLVSRTRRLHPSPNTSFYEGTPLVAQTRPLSSARAEGHAAVAGRGSSTYEKLKVPSAASRNLAMFDDPQLLSDSCITSAIDTAAHLATGVSLEAPASHNDRSSVLPAQRLLTLSRSRPYGGSDEMSFARISTGGAASRPISQRATRTPRLCLKALAHTAYLNLKLDHQLRARLQYLCFPDASSRC
ncbi:hypothetical protein AURDEDRAFT_165809 [Auricularia subglabra TFB-10046 SS5]|nr:hypothetical protein AURDEDRAFT_165809 [Auricularia subglabra TFB-10046 SS5]